MALRDEIGMSAPTSAHGGKPEEICSICDLAILTQSCRGAGLRRLWSSFESAHVSA